MLTLTHHKEAPPAERTGAVQPPRVRSNHLILQGPTVDSLIVTHDGGLKCLSRVISKCTLCNNFTQLIL